MKKKLLNAIDTYMQRAVSIAGSGQERASEAATTKADDSYVTEIDTSLSDLAINHFSPIVGREAVITEEHMGALDEIKAQAVHTDEESTLGEHSEEEYLVIVDPIDGTRNYVHGMPLYGISVGVLRNRRPWLGALAFPALGEMLLCDGETAYLKGTFPDTGQVIAPRPIRPHPARFDPNSIILTSHEFFASHSWDRNTACVMTVDCATVELAWTAMGRSVAAFFGAHIWDLAGAWPIIHAAGLELVTLKTQRRIERFTLDDYDSDNNELMEWSVVCRPEHLPSIISGLRRPQG